jgi:S1-C subfamily serine protease
MKTACRIMLGAAMATGMATSSAVAATPSPQPLASVTDGNRLTPQQIYKRNAASVVVITAVTTETVPSQLSAKPVTEKVGVLGSGFVVNRQGDIVTNDHVVRGGTKIRVGFANGTTYPAKVVGTDVSSDLAVLRVQAPASVLNVLQFARSAAVEVGDPVYAIGNPLGLDRTMTAGIISARGRDIQAPNGRTIPSAIQTDAPINHGNSGGPLLDRYGHVVGVNDQIASSSANGGSIGIGFAISSDRVRLVANQLIASGHVENAWLGVQVATISANVAKLAQGSHLPAHGVLVARVVTGSPASKAGLRGASNPNSAKDASALIGADAIVKVNDTFIGSAQQFATFMAARVPGDLLTLRIVRAGKSRTLSVTLGSQSAHE